MAGTFSFVSADGTRPGALPQAWPALIRRWTLAAALSELARRCEFPAPLTGAGRES
ncbi:MAG: hypothetical protein WKF50_12305 [Nocardioides sp.]